MGFGIKMSEIAQRANKKHYEKNKQAIRVKNAGHIANRRFAEKNGYITRTQAAVYLNITAHQIANIIKSKNAVGSICAYTNEMGITFFTENGLEEWMALNKAYYAGLKKLEAPTITFSKSFMLIVEYMRANAGLYIKTAKLLKLKEKELLYKRYA